MVNSPSPAPTEREVIERLLARYHGVWNDLDLTAPGVRQQLALDVGFLLGLSLRLLDQVDRLEKRNAAKGDRR